VYPRRTQDHTVQQKGQLSLSSKKSGDPRKFGFAEFKSELEHFVSLSYIE
jgi:hypothetical protein